MGATISRKIKAAEWGDGVVERLAAYIAKTQPDLRGFTRANLFRMRQFYETYQDDEKVVPLVRHFLRRHVLLRRRRHHRHHHHFRLLVRNVCRTYKDCPVRFDTT